MFILFSAMPEALPTGAPPLIQIPVGGPRQLQTPPFPQGNHVCSRTIILVWKLGSNLHPSIKRELCFRDLQVFKEILPVDHLVLRLQSSFQKEVNLDCSGGLSGEITHPYLYVSWGQFIPTMGVIQFEKVVGNSFRDLIWNNQWYHLDP